MKFHLKRLFPQEDQPVLDNKKLPRLCPTHDESRWIAGIFGPMRTRGLAVDILGVEFQPRKPSSYGRPNLTPNESRWKSSTTRILVASFTKHQGSWKAAVVCCFFGWETKRLAPGDGEAAVEPGDQLTRRWAGSPGFFPWVNELLSFSNEGELTWPMAKL